MDSVQYSGTVQKIIPVDRVSPNSRHDAAAQIKRRAMDNVWPHVAIFPEGTTTNGKVLISFKTGAFSPGLPIQPMVVRYRNINPAWVNTGPYPILLHLMTQPINFMEVEYLDIFVPTRHEMAHPHSYADRVRKSMAQALNVRFTDHTFLDAKLAMEAVKLQQPAELTLAEFGVMERLFHLDYDTAKAYLEKFSSMDATHSGYLRIDQFLDALNLPLTPFTQEVFQLFDTSDKGYINFREWKATTTSPPKPEKQYSEKELEEEVEARLAQIFDAHKKGRKHGKKRRKSTDFPGYLGHQSTFDKAKKHKKRVRFVEVPSSSSSSSSDSYSDSSEEDRKGKKRSQKRHRKGKKKATNTTFWKTKARKSQFDIAFARGRYSEHSKIWRAASYFKGNAHTWWSMLLLNKTAPIKRLKFKKLFISSWLTQEYERDIRAAWNHLRMTKLDTVDAYYERFWSAFLPASSFKKISFTEQIERFTLGLPTEIRDHCLEKKSASIQELMSHAKRGFAIHSNSLTYPTDEAMTQKDDQISGNESKKRKRYSEKKDTRPKLSPQERTRFIREGKCFGCGETGHISAKCPKKAPKKQNDKDEDRLESSITAEERG
ncbi:hypothetical protein L7F22_042514 [Adiantum nelumboides]|nr:hypothetical protein [Adiantum nelumboides]